jgi:hypothetical protein
MKARAVVPFHFTIVLDPGPPDCGPIVAALT